jgi:general secretion pathway protein F
MTTENLNYNYRAVDPAGVTHGGFLLARSRAAVVEALTQRGLIALAVEEGQPGTVRLWRRLSRWTPALRPRVGQVSTQEVLNLTQSLASLLHAGLTIDRALQITASLAPRESSRKLAEKLLRHVRAGKPLHAAFSASNQRLPNYYLSMVEAGEVGGSLPDALTRLSELMGRQLDLRERIRSALIYPSLLAAMVIVTLIVLLVFVLPRFETLFAESEARLPWSTRAVLRIGRLAADYWWLALLSAGAIGTALLAWLRWGNGRRHAHGWLLKARLTFGVPAALDTSRLLRTVGALCGNGQPLPVALKVARGTLVNVRLQEALTSVVQEVQAGETFSVALARTGSFPALAVQLARVGEETGHLHDLLLSAAGVLERDAQRTIERVLSITVPLLTVVMGLVVAGMIGSVLIGLLSINDLAF